MIFVSNLNKYIRSPIFIMLLLAGIIGVANFALNPNRANIDDKALRISHVQAMALKKVIYVDARAKEAFKISHADNAINVSVAEFDSQIDAYLDVYADGANTVVYCDSDDCDASKIVANKIARDFRIPNVFILTQK